MAVKSFLSAGITVLIACAASTAFTIANANAFLIALHTFFVIATGFYATVNFVITTIHKKILLREK